ncbi:MAG: hypothetical protein AB8B64_12985 [Granulosicoccus sp.]
MTLNQTTNCTIRDRLGVLYRAVTLICILWVLSACGGGLGGSGDGGNNTGRGGNSIFIPLPDAFEPSYQFRNVPERMIAQFPSSLANDESEAELAEASPYNILTSTVAHLIDAKLEIGLLQLHLEVNWQQMVDHCATTSIDSGCDLADAGISTSYSSAMASWEYVLRAGIALERSGEVDTLPDEIQAEIAQLVTAKIGSPLGISSGSLTTYSSGSYRYEVIVVADLGFGETIYTTRWSDDKDLTFVSLAQIGDNAVDNLQSSTNNRQSANGFSNSILMTTFDNGARQERQLNLNSPLNSSDLGFESNLTEIQDSTKIDYYSIGNASTSGGYLSSEQSSENDTDMKISEYFRESFTENAELESRSICRMSSGKTQCDSEQSWEVVTSSDPIVSQYFLSPAQLDEVESRLMPFELDIQGVSLELDTLLLIRRENLTISFSATGVIVTLPGLGTFDLSNNSVVPEAGVDAENPEPFSNFADSVLCRINTALIDGQTQYRSFCAGTTEEIEKALVIGESFREGELVIEWQANASVDVIENQR